MSWKYTVEGCKAKTHDGDCGPCEVVETHWNGAWKTAYRKAESLPHALVLRSYHGDQGYNETPHMVFEHIEGGGLCYFCGKGRGPLCQTGDGNRFLCEPCRTESRRQHERWAHQHGTTPDRSMYLPIISTLDMGA